MSNKFYKSVVFLGGILYPFYTLPWTIKSMLKNEFLGYILFSFFMGLLAYTMIPYDTFDLTRHYALIEKVYLWDIDDIFLNVRFDYYFLALYAWITHQIGLPKEAVPFSYIFMIFMLLFGSLRMVYRYLKEQNIFIQNQIWFSGLALFLIINEFRLVGGASGLRNELAFVLLLYGILRYFLTKRIGITAFIFVLSPFVHLSSIVVIFLFLVAILFQIGNIGRVVFVVSLLILFAGISSDIFFYIVGKLELFLRANGLYFHAYMNPDSAWGANYFAGRNIKTIILEKYIKPAPFFLSALYLLKVKKASLPKIQNFLYLLFIFIVIVSVSRTMLDRFSYFFVLFFIYFLLLEIGLKGISKFKKWFLSLLILSLLLADFGGLVKYRDVITASWTQFLWKPAPLIFLESVEPYQYIHRESL
jgi:hypothetical protein